MNRSRRSFLVASSAGIAGYRFGNCVASAAAPAGLDTGARSGPAKSTILFFLCGGASHVDTWDMKPEAPDTIRGPYQPIATQVPGMRINEMHTQLAKLTDLSLIHI